MSPRLLALMFGVLANLAGAQELRHRGAITGIVPADGGMFVSSQAGILFHPQVTAKPTRALATPDFRIQALALAPNGDLYAAGGIPGEAAVVVRFKAGSQEVFRPPQSDLAYGVAVASDGKQVAVAFADGSVRGIPDRKTLGPERVVFHQHTAPAIGVAFSPDGSLLASCGLDGVLIVSKAVSDEKKPRMLDDHTAGVESLDFSPDGKWIASGSRDSKVRVHESSTGRLVRTFSGLGMEKEPVAGRVIARVSAIVWCDSGLFAGTSKGTLYRLSETDDGRDQILTGTHRGPITAICEAGDHLVFSSGRNTKVNCAWQTRCRALIALQRFCGAFDKIVPEAARNRGHVCNAFSP